MVAYLDRLVKTGIMGNNKTAVVRTLVSEGIRAQIRDKLLKPLE